MRVYMRIYGVGDICPGMRWLRKEDEGSGLGQRVCDVLVDAEFLIRQRLLLIVGQDATGDSASMSSLQSWIQMIGW